MCIELDLARAVENGKGFLVAGAEGFVEPVEVFKEEPGLEREKGQNTRSPGPAWGLMESILEAGHQSTIGTESHLFHDIFKRDEILDIDIGLELKFLCSRV